MLKSAITATALASLFLVTGCSIVQQDEQNIKQQTNGKVENKENKSQEVRQVAVDSSIKPAQEGLQTLAEPESITVLVNKQYSLPEEYEPNDLVYPNVDFIFEEKIEKRMMRSEAAHALEKMFADAETQNLHLAGVSAYRSYQTQQSLFDNYVSRDGLENAKTYSALPGTSEHETGLAIDVTTADGACAAQDCFGDTNEAKWLAEHGHEYGFIIRYPEGKENITGYKYEPWHIRYVGVDAATEIYKNNITLEEYYNAVPVNTATK